MARRKNSPRYKKLLRVARASGKFPDGVIDPRWTQQPRRWYLEPPPKDPRDYGVTKIFKRR